MKTKVYSLERGLRTLKDGVTLDQYQEYLKKYQLEGVKYPKPLKIRIPSMKQLDHWSFDGICETPDGCKVEPDGHCGHGYPSWLLILGFI